jgi:hypothetical protein
VRRIGLIVVLAALWLGPSATTLRAQCWPRYHHYYPGYYGGCGYDLGILYALNCGWNSRRHIAQSERLLGQQIAAMQSAALQSDIRYAMSAEAQRRSEQIVARQQADHDWWLQVQQQQIAERQQAAEWAAMTAGFKPVPTVATDVIKWPPLLQAAEFTEQRAQIEAPYRRSSTELSTPTAADYKNMIRAAEHMRPILKGMTARLTAQEYLDSQVFLDRLAAEARSRLEKTTPKK